MLSDVFKVLALYHLPIWIEDPVGILRFILLVAVGGLIDGIFSLIRYKKLWCCASGAVTAAIISLLSSGAPLWGQLLGITIALVIGKQIWGGTGKNILNPALVGLIPIMLLFDLSYPEFAKSYFYIPALLLGLLFLKVRPFAGIGYMVGMLTGLYLNQELTLWSVLSSGVLFWGCLVMTDPVTVTKNRIAGSAAGFLAGFGGLLFNAVPVAAPLCILLMNLFSAVVETSAGKNQEGQKARLALPRAVSSKHYEKKLIDLTQLANKVPLSEAEVSKLSVEDILQQIKHSELFGMGGAAFPTYRKLETLLTSEEEKYFIINGVECDPGLIHDAWLLRNFYKEIQRGIELIRRCTSFTGTYLAVKSVDGLTYPDYIKLHQVKDLYPIGAERILIAEVLGKQLTNRQIPAERGVLVLNAQTVYAIYEAIYLKKAADTRILTVADLNLKSAQVVRAKLGMKLRGIMEAVYPGAVNLYVGGGIMQASLAEEEDVVDQSVNFIATGSYPTYKESPQCSKCGSCSRYCPCGLKVNLIADLIDLGKVEETIRYNVSECIGCGSCSYLCPAGRNLAARVTLAKNALR
jgi:ferredoxin